MSPELSRVRKALALELARPRPDWRRDVAWLLGTSLVVVGAALAGAWGLVGFHAEGGWAHGAALTAVLITSVGLALRPGRSKVARWVLGMALGTAAWLAWSAAQRGPAHHSAGDLFCAVGEIGVALLPGIAAVAALSRFAYQPGRALLGGLGAAACGLIVLDRTCSMPGATHVVFFHLIPAVVVVLGVVGARARSVSKSFAP